MIRFTLPADGASWDARVTFAALPLADALLALAMLARDVPSGSAAGAALLSDLGHALTPDHRRSVDELFGASFPLGMIAFDVARTLTGATNPTGLCDAIRALPDIDTARGVLVSVGSVPPEFTDNPDVLRSLLGDPGWAARFVHRLSATPSPDPARVVDAVTHPARVRSWIADRLADLFAATFTPRLLATLLAEAHAAEGRMRAAFARDPAGFVALHVPAGATRCLFWPSSSLGAGWATIAMPDGSGLIAYGVETATEPPRALPVAVGAVAPEVAPDATYQDIHRLLADPARWALIRLLVVEPRYGQELSELLGLSIATVSHHLNGLKKLDLVDIRRDEHRLYYHLRADRLRALLAGAEQRLLT